MDDIRNIEPIFRATADGSWLAIAGPGAPVRVGVIEPTQEQARVRFGEALDRVAAALERNDERET